MLVLVVALACPYVGNEVVCSARVRKANGKQEMPDEMRSLKLGVQKHGLIMAMPNPNAQHLLSKKAKGQKPCGYADARGDNATSDHSLVGGHQLGRNSGLFVFNV